MRAAALQTWLRAQALLWPFALVASWLCGAGELPRSAQAAWLLGMGGSFVWVALILRVGRRIADWATFVRFLGLLVVVACGANGLTLAAWTLAIVVVLLDLADGALARRYGGSAEGAVLDMEADQLTVLGLAVLVVRGGHCGMGSCSPRGGCAFRRISQSPCTATTGVAAASVPPS